MTTENILDKLLYICENTSELDKINMFAQDLYQAVPQLAYELQEEIAIKERDYQVMYKINQGLEVDIAVLKAAFIKIQELDRFRQYNTCPDCDFHHCSQTRGCESMRYSKVGDIATEQLKRIK